MASYSSSNFLLSFYVTLPYALVFFDVRTHNRLRRLNNSVGLSYHQRAGSYMYRSRVGHRSRTEDIQETDQASDVSAFGR